MRSIGDACPIRGSIGRGARLLPHVLVAALWASPLVVSAQTAPTPGSCTRAQAEAYLDHNNVRARIVNTGGLFWRGEPHAYEVPKGGGIDAIYTSSLWLGGKVGGELRLAATRFGEWEFWPGPLLPGGLLPNPNDCSVYDRIYEITAADLDRYVVTGAMSSNLRDWPSYLGAPVKDGDGNPDNYDLAAGDLPELIGHQRLWWVMNDVGNLHHSTGATPLGVEVRASAIAASSVHPSIDNSTFYSYQIVNRTSARIDSLFVGVFADLQLGAWYDDQIGADTSIGMAFVYNDDNLDIFDTGYGYGEAPPALGFVLVRGPLADHDQIDNDRDTQVDEPDERAGFAAMMYGDSDGGIWGDPEQAADYYNYMRGRWKDGRPMTYGGYGYYDYSSIPTTFKYPGDPVTGSFWSAVNVDSTGLHEQSYGQRWYTSFGPLNLDPGESAEYVFAYVWARGKDNLDSITELRRAAVAIQDTYEEAIVHAWQPPERPVERYETTLARLHPNPASDHATLSFSVAEPTPVRVELFDAFGRRAQFVTDGVRDAGEYDERIDTSDLAPGVYLYRVTMGRGVSTGSLVVVR